MNSLDLELKCHLSLQANKQSEIFQNKKYWEIVSKSANQAFLHKPNMDSDNQKFKLTSSAKISWKPATTSYGEYWSQNGGYMWPDYPANERSTTYPSTSHFNDYSEVTETLQPSYLLFSPAYFTNHSSTYNNISGYSRYSADLYGNYSQFYQQPRERVSTVSPYESMSQVYPVHHVTQGDGNASRYPVADLQYVTPSNEQNRLMRHSGQESRYFDNKFENGYDGSKYSGNHLEMTTQKHIFEEKEGDFQSRIYGNGQQNFSSYIPGHNCSDEAHVLQQQNMKSEYTEQYTTNYDQVRESPINGNIVYQYPQDKQKAAEFCNANHVRKREKKMRKKLKELHLKDPEKANQLLDFFQFQISAIEKRRQDQLRGTETNFQEMDTFNQELDIQVLQVIQQVENRLNEIDMDSASYHGRIPGCSDPRKTRLLPKHSIKLLENWYEKNLSNPYPSRDQTVRLALDCGLTIEQVRKWFANKRNRSRNHKLHHLMK